MKIKELIRKFGGQTRLANALNIGQSAVSYWVKSDAIPLKWHNHLLSMAQELKIDISKDDLLTSNETGTRLTVRDST